jgi:hypothetical protein
MEGEAGEIAAIKTSYKTKNWFNIYGREGHKKLSLVTINNFSTAEGREIKNTDNAHCNVWFIFIRLFKYHHDDMLMHGFV